MVVLKIHWSKMTVIWSLSCGGCGFKSQFWCGNLWVEIPSLMWEVVGSNPKSDVGDCSFASQDQRGLPNYCKKDGLQSSFRSLSKLKTICFMLILPNKMAPIYMGSKGEMRLKKWFVKNARLLWTHLILSRTLDCCELIWGSRCRFVF